MIDITFGTFNVALLEASAAASSTRGDGETDVDIESVDARARQTASSASDNATTALGGSSRFKLESVNVCSIPILQRIIAGR
jgi:hypothetical protein